MNLLMISDAAMEPGLWASINSMITHCPQPESLTFNILRIGSLRLPVKLLDSGATFVLRDYDEAIYPVEVSRAPENMKAERLSHIGNYARFRLPDYFPEVRQGLFIDPDTVVRVDVRDIEHDIDPKKMFAAQKISATNIRWVYSYAGHQRSYNRRHPRCQHLPRGEQSYSAGFHWFNMKRWRRANFYEEKVLPLIRELQAVGAVNAQSPDYICRSGTQTIFNIVGHDVCHRFRKPWQLEGLGHGKQVPASVVSCRAILHWSGHYKPWHDSKRVRYREFWQHYAISSDVETR